MRRDVMEPISIAAGTLGFKFLEEAIKFLWGEAGKILDRYHKRREGSEESAELNDPAPAALELPAKRTIDFGVVEKRHEDLKRLVGGLYMHAAGFEPVKADDANLLSNADELQALLVDIFGMPSEGLRAKDRVHVDTVAKDGEAIGIEAYNVPNGDLSAHATAKNVKGRNVGVKIDNR